MYILRVAVAVAGAQGAVEAVLSVPGADGCGESVG